MQDLPLVAGGRQVPDAVDHIRRYCGLPWSGGRAETWAWHYYDAIQTAHDHTVTPTDVLAASALHPGLTRGDLAFFRERASEVSAWLSVLDPEMTLWDADEQTLEHLRSLVAFEPTMSVTLASKVLHRKRPNLIPLLDRHIIDWYRPITGERSPARAWVPILAAMRSDLVDPKRRLIMGMALVDLNRGLGGEGDGEHPACSLLRMIDIAVWMGSR